MKKFSNITGQKIGQEPKNEVKIDESEMSKYKIIDLMNRFLRIRSYGAVDNRFLSGSYKIEGKEMLAEALLDLLSDKNTKEQTKLLENLKTKISDWETIDSEIEILNKPKVKLSNRNKINNILEKYSGDNDSLIMFIESNISKITKIDNLKDYTSIISDSQLDSDVKSKIINIYQDRIKQIEIGE